MFAFGEEKMHRLELAWVTSHRLWMGRWIMSTSVPDDLIVPRFFCIYPS